MFDQAATDVENELIKTSASGLVYFAEQKYGKLEHKMDHLACFGGKFLLFKHRTSCAMRRRLCCVVWPVETVQDFLIKLGIKPRMHILIGNKHFFTKSCRRQTYQNYEQPPQRLQNWYFQSHFSASFWIFFFWKEY